VAVAAKMNGELLLLSIAVPRAPRQQSWSVYLPYPLAIHLQTLISIHVSLQILSALTFAHGVCLSFGYGGRV